MRKAVCLTLINDTLFVLTQRCLLCHIYTSDSATCCAAAVLSSMLSILLNHCLELLLGGAHKLVNLGAFLPNLKCRHGADTRNCCHGLRGRASRSAAVRPGCPHKENFATRHSIPLLLREAARSSAHLNCVHIHFQEVDRLVLFRQLVEIRRNHAAWPAPGRREIHNHLRTYMCSERRQVWENGRGGGQGLVRRTVLPSLSACARMLFQSASAETSVTWPVLNVAVAAMVANKMKCASRSN